MAVNIIKIETIGYKHIQFKMALRWYELSRGREYIISHDKTIHHKRFYKGIFIERCEIRGSRLIPIEKRRYGPKFENVNMWYSLFSINGNKTCFFESDTYYDFNKIKDNANQARKNMEQRALDKILKRIVNEEFQW
jgi:hypothetical protein